MANRKLTEEEISEAFASGMEAAHCDLFMKNGPKNGRRGKAWRTGYRQALVEMSMPKTDPDDIKV